MSFKKEGQGFVPLVHRKLNHPLMTQSLFFARIVTKSMNHLQKQNSHLIPQVAPAPLAAGLEQQ